MKTLILVCLLAVSFLSCKEERIRKPYGYLILKVEGQEEPVRWETIQSTWTSSSGTAMLEASGYAFDHCTIRLENVALTGNVSPLTLLNFEYTDGVDFRPHALSGTLTITEKNNNVLKGTFEIAFQNDHNGMPGKSVTGDFGIINDPY